MHLAEILAAHRRTTGDDRADAVAGHAGHAATFRRRAAVPRRGARGARATPSSARNLRHATDDHPDQTGAGRRRAAPTGRRCGWPARRSRTTSCATCPTHLERLEQRVTAAGGTVHWARDAAEANAIVTEHGPGHGADEVVKVKSMATQEIGLNEALAGRGHRRLGDRPRRAHRPARPRHAVAHPGAGHPPQPLRGPGDLPRRDGQGRPPGTRRPQRRPGRARGGGPAPPPREVPARRAWRSPARTSRWPRPARSRSSSPKATAGCA